MNWELLETEENAYAALVAMGKEKVKYQGEEIRGNYIHSEAIKLSEHKEISPGEAQRIIEVRCSGNLHDSDFVKFQDGLNVPVGHLVSNPSQYDGKSCADPLEPEEGTSRARFYANDDSGNPVIHSMLHGGKNYFLGSSSSPDGDAHEKSPITIEELLELADLLEPGDTKGVKEVLAMSGDLDDIDLQELLRRVKSKTKMTFTAMRGFVNRDSRGSADIDHLDIAKKLIEEIGKENVLSVKDGVYIWKNQGVWKFMEKGDICQRVQRAVEKERKVMSAWVEGVTKVFMNEVYKPEHVFNIGNPEVINCPNGELHLNENTGKWELKSHDRRSYRTSQIPVHYDSEATAPGFQKFLSEIFKDDADRVDKIQSVLEMMAYSLVAHCKYELFIILIGAGANGKSVLLSILEALVGVENTVGVQPSQFDNKFQRAHLHHKLANIVTEIRQGEVIADAELKGIVSGEPSTVENKFKDPFTMRPYSTCWFATNHMPHTRDFSEALFRRALIINFNRVFSGVEKNPALTKELLTELPGILNLALDAYAGAVVGGFTKPDSSERAKTEWRLEADQVQQFVLECCETNLSEEFNIKSKNLYAAYQNWADENGIYKTLTMKSFRDRLTRLGFGSKRKKDGWYVTGMDLMIRF